MFIDLLTGSLAALNFIFIAAKEKAVAKQTPPYVGLTNGLENFKPCFSSDDDSGNEKKEIRKKFKTPFERQKEYEDALRKKNSPAPNGDSFFMEWCISNAKMLNEALKGGETIIPFEKLKGVNIDKLQDFFISQENVESCETVNEGILIITRGGV